jgi:hypothetical protein
LVTRERAHLEALVALREAVCFQGGVLGGVLGGIDLGGLVDLFGVADQGAVW